MAVLETEYGPIRRDEGVCRDNYDRLVVYDQPPAGGSPIILQRAAMRSFQLAEERYARRWLPGYPRKLRRPIEAEVWGKSREDVEFRVFRPIYLTGSIRSCATARALYYSEENQERIRRTGTSRYAKPEGTLHPHGLAIDVHTGYLNDRIRHVLEAEGWRQSRPDDEPWHFSFGFLG